MKKHFFLTLLLAISTLIFAQEADDILGQWIAEEETIVQIYKKRIGTTVK